MKRNIFMLIFLMFHIFCFSSSLSADDEDSLIFPNPEAKICIVKAVGKNGALLIGEKLSKDNALVRAIIKQLNFPFHRSIIKLSQCTRNLRSDTKGPNILFLSKTEGGFPRQGLILKANGKTSNYPQLYFVDLVLDEMRVANGHLDIYSHELGHVMMLNIMEEDIPKGLSPKQHVSMGITDYSTAFFEGWGIHFQRLAYDNVPFYQKTYLNSLEYSRSFLRTWHSNIDQGLRLNAVLENSFIHQKLLPAVDTSSLDLETLILLEHTTPVFDPTRIKNAQQMLSSEGVLASLFYRINTSQVLQNNYQDKSFYNHFLYKPMPEAVKPEEIFTPMENVYLKNFYVWNKIRRKLTPESTIIIEFVKEWCNSYSEDKQEILKIFVMTTIGKTITNELGKTFETMSYHGMIGDFQKFRELLTQFRDEASALIKDVLMGKKSLDANIGPQIWVKNKDFLIRTALWDHRNKKPLFINLNTASEFDLASFPKISLEQAKEIIQKREDLGYFESMEQAKACGFEH